MIRLPRRAAAIGLAFATVALLAAVVLLPGPRALVKALFDPAPSAAPAVLAVQREAAERGIQRGYKKAIDQLDAVRKLKIQATPQQIETRIAKATDDLKTLRLNALVAVAGALGTEGDAASRYAADAVQRLDAAGDPGPDTVLLAPRLIAVVQRMNDLAGRIADQTTQELTVPGGPTSAPSPTATPSGSPRPPAAPSR